MMTVRRLALAVLLLVTASTSCASDDGGIELVNPSGDGQAVTSAPAATLPDATPPPATIPPSITQLLGSYDCNNGTLVAGEGTFTIEFKDGDEGSVSGTWRIEGVNELIATTDGAKLRGTIEVFDTTDSGSGVPVTRIEVSLAGPDGQSVEMTMKMLTHTAYIDFTIDGSMTSWGCNKVL
jgi:hypothetical protein